MMSEYPRVFAIGDLHLPGGADKPMHVFGSQWEGHFSRIAKDWVARVRERDIVLVPGDISWAMRLQDAAEDLRAIAELPGRKVLIRGNHDYWWSSIGKVRSTLGPGMYALQNDALRIDNYLFCGSRGWVSSDEQASPEDLKIYLRELQRMELSLQAGLQLAPELLPVVLTHYPPLNERGTATPMTALFERYAVRDVVYGHLHGEANAHAFSGEARGVRYHAVSCDGLGFRLHELIPANNGLRQYRERLSDSGKH